MLDHIFLTVSDINRSVVFYSAVLPALGITKSHDFDGVDGPEGHPDLKGFGANGRVFFWLRQGQSAPGAVHVGFVANSEEEVRSAFSLAIKAGATERIEPSALEYYDPRYFAAQVIDPDGHSLEFVYKSWQHQKPAV